MPDQEWVLPGPPQWIVWDEDVRDVSGPEGQVLCTQHLRPVVEGAGECAVCLTERHRAQRMREIQEYYDRLSQPQRVMLNDPPTADSLTMVANSGTVIREIDQITRERTRNAPVHRRFRSHHRCRSCRSRLWCCPGERF